MSELHSGNGDFDPTHQFPVSERSQAEKDAFREEMALYRRLSQTGEWRDYEATLPPIIGYVPESERAFFSSFAPVGKTRWVYFDPTGGGDPTRRMLYEDSGYLRGLLREGMPQTLDTIENDIAFLDDPYLTLNALAAQTVIPQPGEGQRLHLDGFSYLINSRKHTDLYKGPVRGRFGREINPNLTSGEVDLRSISTHSPLISYPPFAIFRNGPWGVHGRPSFTQEELSLDESPRTHMNFLVSDSWARRNGS